MNQRHFQPHKSVIHRAAALRVCFGEFVTSSYHFAPPYTEGGSPTCMYLGNVKLSISRGRLDDAPLFFVGKSIVQDTRSSPGRQDRPCSVRIVKNYVRTSAYRIPSLKSSYIDFKYFYIHRFATLCANP